MSPALCAPFPLAGHLPSLDRIQNYTVSRRPNTLYTLDHLVEDIKQYLGTSGIDDAHVDHTVLMNFMSKYTSSAADWSRYMRNDPSKNYTRNLVADVSGRANLVCLLSLLFCWCPVLIPLAAAGLEPRKGIPHPRSRQRALYHEDPRRRAE